MKEEQAQPQALVKGLRSHPLKDSAMNLLCTRYG